MKLATGIIATLSALVIMPSIVDLALLMPGEKELQADISNVPSSIGSTDMRHERRAGLFIVLFISTDQKKSRNEDPSQHWSVRADR